MKIKHAHFCSYNDYHYIGPYSEHEATSLEWDRCKCKEDSNCRLCREKNKKLTKTNNKTIHHKE